MSVESSRQRSIFGTISCSSRIACSTRASVEKPVLPRRFRERPRRSKRISPSCWGEPIVNSVPARAKISRSSPSISSRTRVVISPRRSRFSRTPSSSRSRSTRTSGNSISSITASSPRSAICSRCQSASAPRSTASAASGSFRSLARPRSSQSSAEGISAAGRLEQVGAQQSVVDELLRNDPQSLGVMGHHAPAGRRRDDLLRACALARHDLSAAGSREAPGRAFREQLALGRLGGLNDQTDLVALSSQPGDVRGRAGPQPRRQRHLAGRGRGRRVRVAQRLLEAAQRVSELVLAEHLTDAGAIGLAGRLDGDVQIDVQVSLDRRKLAGHAGVLGELKEVRFALGPFDLLDVGEDVLERPEGLQQLAGRLVADPGDARDVVRGVPLQAVEVGDRLGRDPVAVDHRLAVVDLGVGDAPGRRHHLDQAPLVDQLEHIAVPRHDHHLDGRIGVDRPLCDRGDHVVRLVALQTHVAVAECLDQRFHRRPLLLEQIRSRAPGRLVFGEQLAASRCARIPGDDGRADAVLGDDLDEHRGEAEDRVRRHPRRRGDRLGQGEEGPVDEARAIDQEQPAGHHRHSTYPRGADTS